MIDFLDGKKSLASTYWLGVVGFGVIFRFGNAYLINQYLTTHDEAGIHTLDVLHKVFLVTSTIIVLLLLRAMIKAGFNGRQPGGFGWIGIFIACLGVANVGYATATFLMPSLPTPRVMLKMELTEINKQLPQALDEFTILNKAEIVGDDLVYFADVNLEINPEGITLLREAFTTKGAEGAALCRDFEGYFHGGLNSVRYEFNYINKDVGAELTALDCLTYLETD